MLSIFSERWAYFFPPINISSNEYKVFCVNVLSIENGVVIMQKSTNPFSRAVMA